MRRLTVTPREKWQKRVEKVGLTFHTLADGSPYWDESAYWQFPPGRSTGLRQLPLRFSSWRSPRATRFSNRVDWRRWEFRKRRCGHSRAWNSEPPALYGRLDLAYDGNTIKLLEYNADTPTGLVEAAVAQWYWLQDCFPDADQFNSIHEKLIAKWKDLKEYVDQPRLLCRCREPTKTA